MNKPTAIITAASKGMGAACARELSQKGYSLVLMSGTNAIEKIAEELNAKAMIGSVTNPDDLKKLVTLAVDSFGQIDAVINNTGHPARGNLLELTDADWSDGFNLVLMNVVRMANLVTPIMKKQGKGSIVNISTFAALEPSLVFPISSTIRAGLAAYVKLYSKQFGACGIRMNNVLPGFVDSYEVDDKTRSKIPLKREATVEEIAKTVSFLLSEDGGYITGQNIRVDGGLGRSL